MYLPVKHKLTQRMVNIFTLSQEVNAKPIFDTYIYEFHITSTPTISQLKKKKIVIPSTNTLRSCLLFKHRAELNNVRCTGTDPEERERERVARGPRLFRRLVLSRWQQSICAYVRYST